MLPKRIDVDDVDLILKELRLAGSVEWREGGDGTATLRAEDETHGYVRKGDEWIYDGRITIGALAGDFIREKMQEESPLRKLLPPQEIDE